MGVGDGVVHAATLIDDTFVIEILEMYLVYRVTLSFFGSLTEVERLKALRGDAYQRVAHLEEAVDAMVCVRLQLCAEARTAFISGVFYRHLSPSGVNPDELPVELQLIVQSLSGLYGIVVGATLGISDEATPN